jgi:chromosome segregation ATPase
MTMQRRINGTNGATTTMPNEVDELIEVATRFHALLTAHHNEVEATKATLAQLAGVRAELASTQAALAQARDDTHTAQREHEQRMFDAGEAHARQMHEGRAELAALQKAIPERQRELEEWTAAVAEARERHQFVEAKIAAFKKDISQPRPEA